jgi:hypothetical protein
MVQFKTGEPYLPIVCPADYYASLQTTFPEGFWFFKAGGNKDPQNAVVYYSEDCFSSDLRREVIPQSTTILVNDYLPKKAILQAQSLGLRVVREESQLITI